MSILQDRNKGLDFKEQLSTGTRAKERRKLLGTITELRNTFELAFSWEWDYHTCFTDEDSNAQSRAQLFLQLCHWTWDLHADGLELAISASSCPIQGQDPFGCRWGGLRVGFAGEHSYAQCRHGIMTFALDILSLKSEWLVHLQNEAQMSLPVWSTSLGAECLLPCFVPIWARYLSLLWFTFRNNKLPLKAMSASPDWEPSRRAFLFLHLWQLVKAREVFMNRVNQLINHLWFVHSAYFFFFIVCEMQWGLEREVIIVSPDAAIQQEKQTSVDRPHDQAKIPIIAERTAHQCWECLQRSVINCPSAGRPQKLPRHLTAWLNQVQFYLDARR